MKTLKISIDNRPILFFADVFLTTGFYEITSCKYLNENYKTCRSMLKDKSRNIYRIGKNVIIQTRQKDNSKVDFLMTEDICFEGINLVSQFNYEYEFYEMFVEGFEMLDSKCYEDKIWCY